MILRELVNLIGFDVNEAEWKEAEKSIDSLINKAESFGRQATMFFTAPFLGLAGLAIKAQSDSQEALAQIEQSLEKTGNAAGKTVEELAQNAKNLQNATIMEDDAILRKVTAQLLTFTNIAGKEFDRVQQAALDVSAKLDPTMNNLQSVAIQLGKAFNDPKNALSALTRSGIQFTDEQKKMISALVDSGKIVEAQGIMLAELERQYGGSAKALADNSTGIQQLKNDFNDLLELFGADIIPTFRRWIRTLRDSIKELKDNLSPAMRKTILVIGALLAAIGPMILVFVAFAKVGLSVVSVFKAITLEAKGANIATSLFLGKILLIGVAIAAAVAVIALLIEDIVGYVEGNNSLIGQFLEPWSTLAPKLKSYFAPIIILLNDLCANIKEILSGIIDFIMGVFTSDTKRATQGIKDIISGLFEAITNILAILLPILWTTLKALFSALGEWLPEVFTFLWKSALTAVDAILKAIYDTIVGWISSIVETITNAFSNMWQTIKNSSKGFLDKFGLKDLIKSGGELLVNTSNTILPPARGNQFAGAMVGSQSVNSMNNSSSKSLNVKSEIKVYVPEGTPESQATFAGNAARKAAEDVFNAKMNDLMMNIPEVE